MSIRATLLPAVATATNVPLATDHRPREAGARKSVLAATQRATAGMVLIRALATALATATLVSGASPAVAAALAADRSSRSAPKHRVPATGAVVSDEADATRVGLAILATGGNAIDAAVATALALAVVHPEAGNLAGGGFAVIRLADGTLASLDFRETAPAAASPTMYLDAAGKPRPGASTLGPLAAGVPGSPHGYHALHERYGQLPWAAVVAPAIELAREGFALSARSAKRLAEERDRLARFPSSAAAWLPDDRPRGAGERIVHAELAATLEAYAAHGPQAIVTGQVAAAITAASAAGGGVLTTADLAAYRPVWRDPIRSRAFGWELATMPLPSSGGVLVAGLLGLLERHRFLDLPADGVAQAHLFAEAARRVYADRFLLGDPATSRASVADLLAPAWLDRRAASISPDAAIPSAMISAWPAGTPAPVAESNDTTHLGVIDGEGNTVALTTTINDLFDCAVWVPEVGFLNNQMDDFATAPGQPNLYGLIQGEANAVGPGKRMLSSMAPTIAWRDDQGGDPTADRSGGRHVGQLIAIGGRGGSRIPTGTVQVLLRLFAGEPAAAAVARPRLHHQWLPDRLEVELGALAAAGEAELSRMGHTVWRAETAARVQVVQRLPDGRFAAAGDPRGPAVGGVLGAGEVAP